MKLGGSQGSQLSQVFEPLVSSKAIHKKRLKKFLFKKKKKKT